MKKSAAYYRLKAVAEFAASTRAMRKIARYKLKKKGYTTKIAGPVMPEVGDWLNGIPNVPNRPTTTAPKAPEKIPEPPTSNHGKFVVDETKSLAHFQTPDYFADQYYNPSTQATPKKDSVATFTPDMYSSNTYKTSPENVPMYNTQSFAQDIKARSDQLLAEHPSLAYTQNQLNQLESAYYEGKKYGIYVSPIQDLSYEDAQRLLLDSGRITGINQREPDSNINRFKNWDLSKPQIVLMEVPIVGGKIPGVRHTQVTAFLPQSDWDKLPDTEKIKWRSSPYVPPYSNGKPTRVYFRTYSTSAAPDGGPLGGGGPSIGDSPEGDYVIGNILLSRKDPLPVKGVAGGPRDIPAPVTGYQLVDGNIQTYADKAPGVWDQPGLTDTLYFDGINGRAPTHMVNLETYDERKHEDGTDYELWETINDAMNYGVELAEMANLGNAYFLPTNNCHYGTLAATAWNPLIKPGRYSSGGLAGYYADTNDTPELLYANRINPIRRSYQDFYVEQREPTADETTANRIALIKAMKERRLNIPTEQHNQVIDGYRFTSSPGGYLD